MSYTVLARKWRPRNFAEVAGQQPILQTLHNAITAGKLHHAYLFTGTRGVGKTSIARILAKCLSCEQGITATPCGKCTACIGIDIGNYVDVIEVDAASRTKVEDTRALLENVPYAPVQGRCKIYIIDEVHMLSNHSFNALLKTLEEPPTHVKFLLATTEPKKLPVTILSRCLQFHLRNFSVAEISSHLAKVLAAEQINCESLAIRRISLAADGSMRDALTLLEQVIALCANNEVSISNGVNNDASNRVAQTTNNSLTITESAVLQMLGIASDQLLLALLGAINTANSAQIFAIINDLAAQGVDFKKILTELQATLHKIAVYQALSEQPRQAGFADQASFAGSATDILNYSPELLALIPTFAPTNVQRLYQVTLVGQRDLPYAPSMRIGFEMIMLRMMLALAQKITITAPAAAPTPSVTQVYADAPIIAKTEQQFEQPAGQQSQKLQTTQELPPNLPKQQVVAKPPRPKKWKDVLLQLPLRGLVKELAKHCEISIWEADRVELLLDVQCRHIFNTQRQQQLQEALQQFLGRKIKFSINIGFAGANINSAPAASANSKPVNKAHNISEPVAPVTANAKNIADENIKKMQQLLQAEIEQVTTKN